MAHNHSFHDREFQCWGKFMFPTCNGDRAHLSTRIVSSREANK